ncbi:MAG: aryl-sulfate sulfotransferase [Planctomycetes bacterium]|nr:aryl-sulfate sulfotransferase [Planctomycetota bacterium]
MKKGMAVGLLVASQALAQGEPGLRLFAPTQGNLTQLVDGNGTTVHAWPGTDNTCVHLDDAGNLVRAVVEPNNGFPGTTGRLQRLDIDGNVTWDLLVSDNTRWLHHDIEPLPNGNVLVMAVDRMTQAEAIAAGRDPALLTAPDWLPEAILEIQQTGPTTGVVVWEWHVQDNLVQAHDPSKPNYGIVSDHPELVDVNYPPVLLDVIGDWNHGNGIDYDPIHDWIIISSREQEECWIIDHSTTTAEAGGHTGGARGRGGDLLWRWGNPEAYDRGTSTDQQLFRQHDPRFVPPGFPGAGNITIFNNQALPGQSTVIEITLPLDALGMPFVDPVSNVFGPQAPVWSFAEPGFFSAFVSGAQRLRSGNTLICSGAQSRLFEVTPAGQTVWSYTYPSGDIIFQADAIERRLWVSTDELSVASGGRVDCTHLVDSEHDGDIYYLLGSLTGTSPGTPLPGGVTLPLNTDVLLIGMVTHPNVAVFQDTLGTVDALGNATSAIVIPPGLLVPALVGLEMSLAHALIDSTGYVVEISNVVTVVITP